MLATTQTAHADFDEIVELNVQLQDISNYD